MGQQPACSLLTLARVLPLPPVAHQPSPPSPPSAHPPLRSIESMSGTCGAPTRRLSRRRRGGAGWDAPNACSLTAFGRCWGQGHGRGVAERASRQAAAHAGRAGSDCATPPAREHALAHGTALVQVKGTGLDVRWRRSAFGAWRDEGMLPRVTRTRTGHMTQHAWWQQRTGWLDMRMGSPRNAEKWTARRAQWAVGARAVGGTLPHFFRGRIRSVELLPLQLNAIAIGY